MSGVSRGSPNSWSNTASAIGLRSAFEVLRGIGPRLHRCDCGHVHHQRSFEAGTDEEEVERHRGSAGVVRGSPSAFARVGDHAASKAIPAVRFQQTRALTLVRLAACESMGRPPFSTSIALGSSLARWPALRPPSPSRLSQDCVPERRPCAPEPCGG